MTDKKQYTLDELLKLSNELFTLAAKKRNEKIEDLPDGKEKDDLLKEKVKSEKNRDLFNMAIVMAENFAEIMKERMCNTKCDNCDNGTIEPTLQCNSCGKEY